MRKAARGYHHGDLRAALLRAAETLVAREGLGRLTLRQVAKRAGVSHAAPYHHFADKAALVGALSESAFGDLDRALERGERKGGRDAGRRLTALGQAYVAYAVSHPHQFRFMFRPELVSPDTVGSTTPAAGRALARLVGAVDGYLKALGRADEDPYPLAMTAWGCIHGVASLWVDGPLANSGYDERVVARLTTQVLVNGIASGVAHSGTYTRRTR